MTQISIPSEPIDVSYAVTSSSVGPFVVPFSFLKQQDVVVIVTDALLVETVYELITDYFFSSLTVPPGQEGSGFTGGEITLVLPIGADLNSSIRILRSTVIERLSNYPTTGPFSMPLLNDEQNNHIAIMQELAANQAGGVLTNSLQQVTDVGNTTDNSIVMELGGVLSMEDAGQTQTLTISQTSNPATIDTTGAGINFTGASSEYHFNTGVRAVGYFNAQSNGYVSSTNGLGTERVQLQHDDTWGNVEIVGAASQLLLNNPNGGVYLPERAAGGADALGFGQFFIDQADALPYFQDELGAVFGLTVGADATSGNFTGTITGVVGAGTGTIEWARIAVTGGDDVVHLSCHAGIIDTANATTFAMTGLPVALRPATQQTGVCFLRDNSAFVCALFKIESSGQIDFYYPTGGAANSYSFTTWTASGSRALEEGWHISYRLD